MDQKIGNLHSGILHSQKKEWTPTFWDSMDGTGEHYSKWNKPDVKDKYHMISSLSGT